MTPLHMVSGGVPDGPLDELATAGELEVVDLHFARLLRRLGGGGDADPIALSGALVSRERSRGHPCVALRAWAGRPLADEATESPLLPSLGAWEAALKGSALVGDGSAVTPLVLASGRLYLYRYWKAERQVAERIRTRAALAGSAPDPASLATLFARLFPPRETASPDLQAVAAGCALHAPLTLISGGPGTGKTTTVTKILGLALQAAPGLRIALAAPTGKAAARLTESVAEGVAGLSLDRLVDEQLTGPAQTIHRLLRHSPPQGSFRYNAQRPLPCDLLVVDEASMIDLLMMDALLAAVPVDATLVLVGDKDQLASVEAGFVFGDICEAASGSAGYSRPFAEFYAALSGMDLPVDPKTTILGDRLIELRTSYRFQGRPGIERIAAAIREGNAEATLEVLASSAFDHVQRIDHPEDAEAIVDLVEPELTSFLAAPDPAEALARLERFRVLCVTNRGRYGVDSLNRAFDRRIETLGRGVSGRWYHGRPVIISANDYVVELFNGDVGVCLADRHGQKSAWFRAAGGAPRSVALGRLPEHATAWALTVHKSQGSEFDRVVVVLPEQPSALLTRELIYTAATRARESVVFVGPAHLLSTAVNRRAERTSGLRDLLSQRSS